MNVPLALAGVWAASGIAAAVLVWRAIRKPVTRTDDYCARVDQELDARPTFIGSDLDALVEDSLVAQLDDLWDLPTYEGRL